MGRFIFYSVDVDCIDTIKCLEFIEFFISNTNTQGTDNTSKQSVYGIIEQEQWPT